MSCLSTARKTRIQERITRWEAYLDRLDTAQQNNVLHVEGYTFDSGEGKQTMKFRSPQHLSEEIERVEQIIDRLYNQLYGTGLMNMNVRRKNRSGN
jgi:hypothetical protein